MKDAKVTISDNQCGYIKLNENKTGSKVKTQVFQIPETSVELLIDKNEEGIVIGIEILGCQDFFSEKFLEKFSKSL
jgi:uncharacterized protein YuzE